MHLSSRHVVSASRPRRRRRRRRDPHAALHGRSRGSRPHVVSRGHRRRRRPRRRSGQAAGLRLLVTAAGAARVNIRRNTPYVTRARVFTDYVSYCTFFVASNVRGQDVSWNDDGKSTSVRRARGDVFTHYVTRDAKGCFPELVADDHIHSTGRVDLSVVHRIQVLRHVLQHCHALLVMWSSS